MRRRIPLFLVGAVVLAVLVLAVQVQLARTGPRLDDEVGFRPRELGVGGTPSSTVVWLGDSTSTGVGVDDVQDSMAHRVAAAEPDGVVLTILGRSGAQVHEVLDEQVPALRRLLGRSSEPVTVYVSIGANDVTALTRRPTFRGRYRELVREIATIAPDAELVLVGIPDMGTAPRLPRPLRQIAGLRASQLDDDIAHLAEDIGAHHVDLASRTSAIFSSDPDRYFAADDFHPSAAGHAVWADAVVESVAGSAG